MKRRNNILSTIICFFLFSIFIAQSLFSQQLSSELKEVLKLRDTRTTDMEKFSDLIDNGETQLLTSIAYAIANIGDSVSTDLLKEILQSSSDIGVKKTAIFALGLINTPQSRDILLASLKTEKDPAVLAHVFDSFGKIQDEYGLNEMLKYKTGDDKLRAAIALSIARFGIRKIKTDASFLRLAELMESSADSTIRRNIAYAFSRIGDMQTLLAFNTELVTLSSSPEPLSRMWGLSAIGKQLDTGSIEYLLESFEKEQDWRVRVNICNALGNQKIDMNSTLIDKTVSALLVHAVEDQSAHVSIVAWQALGKLFAESDTRNPLTRKIQQDIQFVLTPGKAIDWQIKAEAIRTYAKIFKDECKDELLSLFSQTDNYDIKAAIVGAFGNMQNAMVYKELRDSVSADVQRYNAVHPNKDGSMIGSRELAKVYLAFVDALTSLDDRLDDENRNIIRLILSEFASSKDPAITDVCLSNLQDSIYLQYRSETCQIMMFDYSGFEFPKDKDVMLQYIQFWDKMKFEGAKEILTTSLKHSDYDIAKASADALKSITSREYEKEITAPKYRLDHDWKFIESLSSRNIATIKTSRGEIKVKLNEYIAPFTVQNFIKLGKSGYYNNTVFHRVIPNFVIQGGDPTGTGYGGPGYSIRSEFSDLPFDAYTVGMASSGKDTEGSQFFITHSPQYHLDGKYTLFGAVIEGFDVVDRIQNGDIIETISFGSK